MTFNFCSVRMLVAMSDYGSNGGSDRFFLCTHRAFVLCII